MKEQQCQTGYRYPKVARASLLVTPGHRVNLNWAPDHHGTLSNFSLVEATGHFPEYLYLSGPLIWILDGINLITEKAKILDRWAKHFESVLNRPSAINDDAVDRLVQVNINHELDTPQESEVKKAVDHLSGGKAPGTDTMPAEVYKATGTSTISKLTELLLSF